MQKKLRKWAILALLLVLFISHTVAANATTGDPDYTVYTYHALIDALDSAEAGDIIGIMDTIVVSTPQELVFGKGDQGARVTLKRMSSNAQIIFRDTGFGGGSVVEKIRFNGNSALVSGSSAFVRVEGKDPDPTLTPADNKPEPSPSTPDKTDQSGSGDGNDKPTGDNSSNKPSSGGNTATDNNQSSNNGSHSTVNNSSSKSESIKTENSNNTSTVNNYYTQNNPQKEEVVTAQSIPAPVRDTPTVVNVPESRSNEVSLIG